MINREKIALALKFLAIKDNQYVNLEDMELMYPDGFDDHSPFRFIKWEDREWAINILTEAFVELDQKETRR